MVIFVVLLAVINRGIFLRSTLMFRGNQLYWCDRSYPVWTKNRMKALTLLAVSLPQETYAVVSVLAANNMCDGEK